MAIPKWLMIEIRLSRASSAALTAVCFMGACGAPRNGEGEEARPFVLVQDREFDLALPAGTLVTQVALGSHGRIAFATRRETGLWLAIEDGEQLRRLGGPGDGPGEFRAVSAVGWVGDTIWASDPYLRRIGYFSDSAGWRHMRTEVPRQTHTLSPGAMPWGILADGDVLWSSTFVSSELAAGPSFSYPLVDQDRRRGSADTILVINADRLGLEVRLDGGTAAINSIQPFAYFDRWALSGDGAWVAYAKQNYLELSRNGSVEVGLINTTTRARMSWPLRLQSPELREDDVRRWVDSFRLTLKEGRSPLAGRVSAENVFDALFVPTHISPIEGVVAGERGDAILLVRSQLHRELLLLSGEAQVARRIEPVPEGRIVALDGERVVIVVENPFGSESFVVARLVRQPKRPYGEGV